MASPRKTPWQSFQEAAGRFVFDQAPKMARRLYEGAAIDQVIQRGIEQAVRSGIDALFPGDEAPPRTITPGRPVTHRGTPTAHRARRIAYAPNLNGRADPGEVVWTWVAFEEDPDQGKDRPVLIVGRDGGTLLGLMLSSQEHHRDDRNWVGIGTGDWDYEHRRSWVRLDRILDVPEEGIRREGAILPRIEFETVAARLRRDYSWR